MFLRHAAIASALLSLSCQATAPGATGGRPSLAFGQVETATPLAPVLVVGTPAPAASAAAAVPAQGARRAELWASLLAAFPFFADHQAGVDREIPLASSPGDAGFARVVVRGRERGQPGLHGLGTGGTSEPGPDHPAGPDHAARGARQR